MTAPARYLGCWIVAIVMLIGAAPASADLRLLEAAKGGNASEVAALLKEKVDVNTRQADGATALHWAAHRNDLATADLLIKAGASVDATNDFGVTPLWLAAENGSAAMLRRLLDAGANPNLALPSGETALMTAARTGNADAVDVLVGRGANMGASESSKGQTAIMWAAAEGHANVGAVLVKHGADIHARSQAGYTPLMFAAREGSREFAKLLLEAGADVNQVASNGTNALLIALIRGHVPFVEFLLDRGADVNAAAAGYTALHWATGTWGGWMNGATFMTADSAEWMAFVGFRGATRLAVVRTLLAHGANPNAVVTKSPPRHGGGLGDEGPPDIEGATPFLLAAGTADVAVMQLLLANGADPRAPTKQQTTPLMMAAGLGRIEGVSRTTEAEGVEAVKLVIHTGSDDDVNAANFSGVTAMHAAAAWGANSIVRLLVANGGNIDAKNKHGEAPVHWASGTVRLSNSNTAHPPTVALFRELGTQVNPDEELGPVHNYDGGRTFIPAKKP